MVRKRKYPPAYYRYQSEHPAITIHISKKIKSLLDNIKGSKSYSVVVYEILSEKLGLDDRIKELPKVEAVIMYKRGYYEAMRHYAIFDHCPKCGKIRNLWNDGICDECHRHNEPDYSLFRDMDIAALVDEGDFARSGIKMPETEYLSYRNGIRKGYDDGYGSGYDAGKEQGMQECEERYRITIPCSVCEEEITLKPGTTAHKRIIQFLRENGWRHKNH